MRMSLVLWFGLILIVGLTLAGCGGGGGEEEPEDGAAPITCGGEACNVPHYAQLQK